MQPHSSRTSAVRLASGLSGALFAALTPICALVLLDPELYGLFSVVYLISAFGISLQYSIISEAWARHTRAEGETTAWSAYCTALAALATLVGVVAGIVGQFLFGQAVDAVVLGAAALFTVYRSGSRYFEMATGAVAAAVRSDVLGALVFVIAVVAADPLDDVARIALAWLSSTLVSALAMRLPRLAWGFGPISWWSAHRRNIHPLLADSLLMDLGAIGTPFLLAGFMGAHNFGIYRAVSNAAMPVRLMIDPMRPVLGRMTAARLSGFRFLALMTAAALALGLACFAVLEWLLPSLPFTLGTLSSLTPYAAAAGLFVVGSFLGTVYYIGCRTNAAPRQIMAGRLIQTALVVSMPIGGFVWLGLAGAIWGFSISSLLTSATWILLLSRARSHRGSRPQPATTG